jgi:DNA polymerase (family X)
MLSRQDVAAVLRQYAQMLDLLGDEPFRARAFENASRALEAQTESLESLMAGNRLSSVKGIGAGVSAAIVEIVSKGTFADLETVREKIPLGVFDLLRIDGLGVKKAKALWQDAHVTSLDELEAACNAGIIEKMSGFGAKTVEKFRAGLSFIREVSGRHWRHHAVRAARALEQILMPIPGVKEVFFGGSLRRGCETVGDLDVLIITEPSDVLSVQQNILALPDLRWSTTGEIASGQAFGFPIELSVVSTNDAAVRKILVTGSNSHVQALKQIAGQRGFKFEPEDGSGRQLSGAAEADIYSALGLLFVPPALRDHENILRPLNSAPYPKPVRAQDIHGILHCHSTWSDGHHSIREMAAAMIDRGYAYLGIADHSQVAAYARGLTPDRVRGQWAEIDALNKELSPFRILKGTEADILPDGSLDFPDDLLAGFDFVVGSVHSGLNMSEAEATERIGRALTNPHLDILGHATGRLLLERRGYPLNHENILEVAARYGKAIELNSSPHRLDLDWRYLPRCEALRIPVPLCPDAHNIDGLWDIQYGLEAAAKGPLTAANCLSTWPVEQFNQWCQTHERSR